MISKILGQRFGKPAETEATGTFADGIFQKTAVENPATAEDQVVSAYARDYAKGRRARPIPVGLV